MGLRGKLRSRDNSIKRLTTTATHQPTNRPPDLTQACTTLQAGEEALGRGGRAQNPWEGGLAGFAGTGSKPEGSGCSGKVFVLREVTEINASTHG